MIDISKFRVNPNAHIAPFRTSIQKRINGKFLKGPISVELLSKITILPGKSLHLMIVIWILDTIHNGETFKLSMALLRKLNVGRNAAYRALECLENAGIITVDRLSGRLPLVTLIMRGDT